MTNEPAFAGQKLSRPTHAEMIASLLAAHPEIQTKGFFRELAKVGDYMKDILRNDPEWRARVNMVPDAFVIDHEGGHVVVFEIVDTSDVTPLKLAKIEEIGWALDQDYFDIGLIRIDRYGRSLHAPVEDGLARLTAKDLAA